MAIGMLKYWLYPDADFSNREDFKRQCGTIEAYDRCGSRGILGRRDSLERHCKNQPPEYIDVGLDKAETKGRVTEGP